MRKKIEFIIEVYAIMKNGDSGRSVGCPIKMLVSFMESQKIHLGPGQTMIKLSIKEHQAINVYILYLQKSMNLKNPDWKKNKLLFIVEFLLQNKKMTLKDNVYTLVVSTQIVKLLKTLDQDSITKDVDFLNYWKCLINESSTELLSLLKTDFVDSDLNLSNGYSYRTIQKSWFSIRYKKHINKNSQRTFLPFYKFLLAGGTDKEDTKHLRMRKIKIKNPTSLHIKRIKGWNDDARYSYNKAICIINGQDKINKSEKIISTVFSQDLDNKDDNGKRKPVSHQVTYDKYRLRDMITPESACSRIPWILKTPKSIREASVFEASKNLSSALSNKNAGNITRFSLRYKSRKKDSWTIGLPKSCMRIKDKRINLFEKLSYDMEMNLTEKILDNSTVNTETLIKPKHDCTLHFDGMSYYICIPFSPKKRVSKNSWMCAIDPGSRKFQTVYSPENGNYTIIGDRASNVLYEKLLQLDQLISKKNSKNKDRIRKLRNRIKNLQSELHHKTSKYLCDNYKTIYIPKLLKNNDIISKSNRRIQTKTVRSMVVLGHCKFVDTLKAKANLYTNVQVHVITEEYTSQVCLNCKKRTKTSNEIWICNSCNFTIDRDALGSTNILLKNW